MSTQISHRDRWLATFLLVSFFALGSQTAAMPQSTPLGLDILPGACPNSYRTGQAGVLPVSILGSATLDVTTIDVGSVQLCSVACPGGPLSPSLLSYSYQDTSSPAGSAACACNVLGGDGFTDLRLKFDRTAVTNALALAGLAPNSLVTVIVTGNFLGGGSFTATDCLKVTKSNGQSDCDGDGVNDNQEADCNLNGTPDDCEIFADCNHDGVPDTCQLTGNDCNQNGVPDECDPDCNQDGVPDACQALGDCNHDGIADICQMLADCDANGTPDVCQIAAQPSLDSATGGSNPTCIPNGILDACEGLGDCDLDGVRDVCQADCDADGLADACEIDANRNGIPDDCEAGAESPSLGSLGSLLVFPEFASTVGSTSLLTVTNANGDPTNGSVLVEWVYLAETTCLEFNRTHLLTPRDTLTVLASAHNPSQTRGYLYVFAKSVTTGQAISFNFLAGDSIRLDGIGAFDYAIPAIPFQAMRAQWTVTDLDSDGIRDLDGHEYSRCPDRVVVPRFLGQRLGDDSRLILIGLTGGGAFTTTANFLLFNDNEEVFSAQYQFQCWAKPLLIDISGIFTRNFLVITNHAVNEVFGNPFMESGWFELNGAAATSTTTILANPAVIGVLVEGDGTSHVAGLPYGVGLQGNGDLLPHGQGGDL